MGYAEADLVSVDFKDYPRGWDVDIAFIGDFDGWLVGGNGAVWLRAYDGDGGVGEGWLCNCYKKDDSKKCNGSKRVWSVWRQGCHPLLEYAMERRMSMKITEMGIRP